MDVKSRLQAALIRNAGGAGFQAYLLGQLQGLPTGIKSFDAAVGGIAPLTLIQGMTKSNKSTLALQAAHIHAYSGNPVYFIDVENGARRTRTRLICQAHNISARDVKLAAADAAELERLGEAVDTLPFAHIHSPPRAPEELEEAVVGMLELWPGKKPLLVVDSLQRMPKVSEAQHESLERWMNVLNDLKNRYEGSLSIIATSELNRSSYEEARLGGAKGSGSIEYIAELAIDMRATDRDTIKVKVLANRDGQQGEEFEIAKGYADASDRGSFSFRLVDALPSFGGSDEISF